jgi:hypothetical protein
MTFKPETTMLIKEYQFQKKTKGSIGKYIMNLVEGGFRTITGTVAKNNPNDYQINTPVATIGVRGTDYAVQYNEKDGLVVGYYQGTPCIKNTKGEICLNEKMPYARVPDAISPPQTVAQQPAAFKEKLKIIAATIEMFNSGSTGSGKMSGTVNSFCIQ